jgi:hypothetical protein
LTPVNVPAWTLARALVRSVILIAAVLLLTFVALPAVLGAGG